MLLNPRHRVIPLSFFIPAKNLSHLKCRIEIAAITPGFNRIFEHLLFVANVNELLDIDKLHLKLNVATILIILSPRPHNFLIIGTYQSPPISIYVLQLEAALWAN